MQSQPVIGAVNNRLRLSLFGKINPLLSLTFAYDFSPRIQDRSLFVNQILPVGLNTAAYRAADIDSRLYPDEGDSASSFAVFQNLDRGYLTIKSELADIYVGRQAIAWGSAHVINPTDVIAPYAFNELDIEDRIGVDAIRVRFPTGMMGEIDAGYVFGDDFAFENSAMFLRSRLHHRHTDLSLLACGFRENLLAGFDLTRSIGGAGFWLEGGYVLVDALGGKRRNNDEDYFRSSLGLDYSLSTGAYLSVEYHFNQAGASEPDRYLAGFEEVAYREGSVYLMGMHYLAPGISGQVTPLVTLVGESLINLVDPSIFLMPQVEYNIAENIYLSAGAYLGLGKNPHSVVSQDHGSVMRLRSEFGAYPDSYFTSFRVYF
jgi:hypothetical protein